VALEVARQVQGTVTALARSGPTNSASGTSPIAVAESPTAAPVPALTPAPSATAEPGGNKSYSTATFTVSAPASWTVATMDSNNLRLVAPSGKTSLFVFSGSLQPPRTVSELLDDDLAALKKDFPDAALCPGASPFPDNLGGISGQAVTFCFTFPPLNGTASPEMEYAFEATASTNTIEYAATFWAPAADKDAFLAITRQYVESVQWQLRPSSASPGSNASTSYSTSTFTVSAPSGWLLDAKDSNNLRLRDPSGTGSLLVYSGNPQSPKTISELLDGDLATLKSSFPDAVRCPGASPAPDTIGGVKGQSVTFCYTGQAVNGSPTPYFSYCFEATAANNTVEYAVTFWAPASEKDALLNVAKGIANGVQWQLK
jgi:hypothetical protein